MQLLNISPVQLLGNYMTLSCSQPHTIMTCIVSAGRNCNLQCKGCQWHCHKPPEIQKFYLPRHPQLPHTTPWMVGQDCCDRGTASGCQSVLQVIQAANPSHLTASTPKHVPFAPWGKAICRKNPAMMCRAALLHPPHVVQPIPYLRRLSPQQIRPSRQG